MTFEQKLENLRLKLEEEQLIGLIKIKCDCEANRINHKCTLKPAKKYTKLDIGTSGRYMIVNKTGEIYGIKAYGVINKIRRFGTLDTITEYYWGDYHAVKLNETA